MGNSDVFPSFTLMGKMATEQQHFFREILLELSHQIDQNDLQKMKFMCQDIIKKRQSEKITDVLELFVALEERGKLEYNNVSFLKTLLMYCTSGKINGLRVLERYEQRYPGVAPGNDVYRNAPPFQGSAPGPGVPGSQPPQVVYVVQNQGPVQNGDRTTQRM